MRRGRLAPWIHSHVTEFDQHLQKILRQQVGQFVAGPDLCHRGLERLPAY